MPTLKNRFALAYAISLLTTLVTNSAWAAPHAPDVAPISAEPIGARLASSRSSGQVVSGEKQGFAHMSAAAICTEDLATISFQEYSVDWSDWLHKMTNSWTTAMNSTVKHAGIHPSGPMFVEFTCNRDGTIGDVFIDRSSGDKLCDALQIGTLLRSTPLPAFPAQSKKHSITLLCIWSYPTDTHIASANKRAGQRPVIRVSISGNPQ